MGLVLNSEQKVFIVTAYARFEGTAEIIRSFRERWDAELTHSQCNHYNVIGASCNCAPKWKEVFHAERKRFLANVEDIGIANKTFRLHSLSALHAMAMKRNNVKLAQEILEQAAKEMGEVFTNRREVKSDVRSVTATMTTDQLRQEILKDLNTLGIEAPQLQIGVVKDDGTKH